MVTLTIVAVMATVLIPRLQDQGRLRLIAGSRLLSSDIEMAQIMTISNPAGPIVIKFQQGTGTYWLASAADPDTPILRPGAVQQYLVKFGEGRGRTARGVTFGLIDLPNDILSFNEQGGLTDPTIQPRIKLMHDSRWIKLSISSTTGSITEMADND